VERIQRNNKYEITKIDTYQLSFSNEKIDILFDYVENEVSKNNSNIINKYNNITENEKNYLKAQLKKMNRI